MGQRSLLLIGFVLISFLSSGQTDKQLVLFNREKIIARYGDGDEITFRLKHSRAYITRFVTDLNEFSLVSFKDTIQFSSIDRISLKGHAIVRFRKVSYFLIAAGLGYFLIDEVNNVVVQGHQADLEPTVWKPSLAMVAVGSALKLARRRSLRLHYPVKLLTVKPGTQFYLAPQQ